MGHLLQLLQQLLLARGDVVPGVGGDKDGRGFHLLATPGLLVFLLFLTFLTVLAFILGRGFGEEGERGVRWPHP